MKSDRSFLVLEIESADQEKLMSMVNDMLHAILSIWLHISLCCVGRSKMIPLGHRMLFDKPHASKTGSEPRSDAPKQRLTISFSNREISISRDCKVYTINAIASGKMKYHRHRFG